MNRAASSRGTKQDVYLRRRLVALGSVLAVLLAIAAVVAGAFGGTEPVGRPPPGALALTVRSGPLGSTLQPGFLGLSLEYPTIEQYAGTNPAAIDPVFVRLVRGLNPGQAPVLRIGGDSTDWTWWPVPGLTRPPGVTYTVDARWTQVARSLVRALGARVILGINLEADSEPLAAVEAGVISGGIGPGAVEALELGNEPALYGTFAWYHLPDGQGVPGRPHDYDFNSFTSDYQRLAQVLPRYPLAGPSMGSPKWTPYLSQFLNAEPRVRLVTVHGYPLQLCFIPRFSPRFPSVANLLAPSSSSGLANRFAQSARIAHAHHLQLRIDEINSVSCGADPSVSKTFAAALWALDAMFELARAGIDGVNIHTFPGAGYELFEVTQSNGRWLARVEPEYYGLLAFAQAAPAGSRLLPISGSSDGSLKSWATRAPDGTIHVALIDKGSSSRLVALRLPGQYSGSIERLLAPSSYARTGVTLGGRSFGNQTPTGLLAGRASAARLATVRGWYVVRLGAASAAVLTFRPS